MRGAHAHELQGRGGGKGVLGAGACILTGAASGFTCGALSNSYTDKKGPYCAHDPGDKASALTPLGVTGKVPLLMALGIGCTPGIRCPYSPPWDDVPLFAALWVRPHSEGNSPADGAVGPSAPVAATGHPPVVPGAAAGAAAH